MIAQATAASNQFDVFSSRGLSAGYTNSDSQDHFSNVTMVNQAFDELFKDLEVI